MVVWDWTLASIRPSELPLFIPVFFSFGGMIIPLPKPKLYSIPRFENEKEKKKKTKNNNFTDYGYIACLSDGGRFFFVNVVAVPVVYVIPKNSVLFPFDCNLLI